MKRIESSHSAWLFDTDRMRFRRVPKGADAGSPSLDSDWEPYYELDVDRDTGSFTVALNEDRTRLLRSWSDSAGSEGSPPDDDTTTELSLETIERPDG